MDADAETDGDCDPACGTGAAGFVEVEVDEAVDVEDEEGALDPPSVDEQYVEAAGESYTPSFACLAVAGEVWVEAPLLLLFSTSTTDGLYGWSSLSLKHDLWPSRNFFNPPYRSFSKAGKPWLSTTWCSILPMRPTGKAPLINNTRFARATRSSSKLESMSQSLTSCRLAMIRASSSSRTSGTVE